MVGRAEGNLKREKCVTIAETKNLMYKIYTYHTVLTGIYTCYMYGIVVPENRRHNMEDYCIEFYVVEKASSSSRLQIMSTRCRDIYVLRRCSDFCVHHAVAIMLLLAFPFPRWRGELNDTSTLFVLFAPSPPKSCVQHIMWCADTV